MSKYTKYYVDLRSYPLEERERMHDILNGFSFMCNYVAGVPGVFTVICDSKESIEDILQIPAELVQTYLAVK